MKTRALQWGGVLFLLMASVPFVRADDASVMDASPQGEEIFGDEIFDDVVFDEETLDAEPLDEEFMDFETVAGSVDDHYVRLYSSTACPEILQELLSDAQAKDVSPTLRQALSWLAVLKYRQLVSLSDGLVETYKVVDGRHQAAQDSGAGVYSDSGVLDSWHADVVMEQTCNTWFLEDALESYVPRYGEIKGQDLSAAADLTDRLRQQPNDPETAEMWRSYQRARVLTSYLDDRVGLALKQSEIVYDLYDAGKETVTNVRDTYRHIYEAQEELLAQHHTTLSLGLRILDRQGQLSPHDLQ